MTLKLIGLGLHDENGISIKGLKEAKGSNLIYAEFYTNLMQGLSNKKLELMLKKPVKVLKRGDIEDHPEESILKYAAKYDVALLVPGDPMNATTHVDLCLRAKKKGIKTTIIHAASITSAVPGVTGLQSYKFGRTVTIPIPRNTPPLSPYDHILENFNRGLHTLILLDIDVENEKFLLIPKAIKHLQWMEKKRRQGLITPNRLIIGAARIGGPDMEVKSGSLSEIIRYDFKAPPHTIILPGDLHFLENEALQSIAIKKSDLLEKDKRNR